MIFAYSGRRSTDIDVPAQALVAERLRKLLTQVAPSAVVGAAACGADLILLEEALRLRARHGRPQVHVVLPTPVDRFRAESVEAGWRERFDDVLATVTAQGGTVEAADGTATDVYAAGNLAILDRAQGLADDAGERAVALVVAAPGAGTYVSRFVDQASLRGIRELRIDPTISRAEQRRCFVIMPYGEKWDDQRGFRMNCDLTYSRFLVPALEHAQLHYRRADETVDPGVVLRPMIDDIAQAELVIADLATSNFNVGWELGLRHLLARRGTILIKPTGRVPAPFDVQALRSVSYDHGEDGFDDDAVLAAWERLEPYLTPVAQVGTAPDSPVVELMDVELASIAPAGHEQELLQRLRERLADARDVADDAHVEAIVEDARQRLDDPEDQRLVFAEAGTILRRLGHYGRAAELLAPIVEADREVRRPAAYQQLAMALYQSPDATAADHARAEELLLEVRRAGGYPENDSLLGAVAKRRARLVTGADRRIELERARDAYRAEYLRNLNDHYAGINVLAVDAVLAHTGGDDTDVAADAAEELERLLPAVRLAAELRLRQAPADYWAHASRAEVELVARLGGASDSGGAVRAAYRGAAELRPLPAELASTRTQLDWYEAVGVPAAALALARAGLDDVPR